jgi:glycosyltransferase involved in cell wall biosynthesis
MLRIIFPWNCNDDWTGHPPFALTRHLSRTDLRAELWVRRRGPRARVPFVHAAVPERLEPLVWLARRINRWLLPVGDWVSPIINRRYVRGLGRGDMAILYRACPMSMFEAIKRRGAVIALELSNTMPHTIYRLLEEAYRRAGWPVQHDLEPRELQAELDRTLRKAQLADVIVSPSPAVTQSLREVGIPEPKILSTSYGWDPDRFRGASRPPPLPAIDGVTVLFVGTVCERKGAHLLLDAWRRAGIDGRLVLLGGIGTYLAHQCAELLRQPNVIQQPFVADPSPYFHAADLLVLPTLEEGSPLVIYEAMGVGLPVLTSPMGAGEVLRHDREGLVIDPYDQEALIAMLRRLARDVDLRRRLGSAGRARAREYTWDRVAQRRYSLIHAALGSVLSFNPLPQPTP